MALSQVFSVVLGMYIHGAKKIKTLSTIA